MSIRYALETQRTAESPAKDKKEYLTEGYSLGQWMRSDFQEVPQVVAEMDENGHYAVFSAAGRRISDWFPLNSPEKVKNAWMNARAKPSSITQRDSIKHELKHRDYVFSHSEDNKNLQLFRAIRNQKTRVQMESLSGFYLNWNPIRSRQPEALIRVPLELIEGGEAPIMQWKRRYAIEHVVPEDDDVHGFEEKLRDVASKDIFFNLSTGTHVGLSGRYYEFVSEAEAANAGEAGMIGIFNEEGFLVSGWIDYETPQLVKEALQATRYGNKKIVKSLETPHTDVMGTDIALGDIVFTNDNHYNTFMPYEVVGFTDTKVQVLGWFKYKFTDFMGHQKLSFNLPRKLLKLPVSIL